MDRPFSLRLALAIFLSLLPAAIVLIVLAAGGTLAAFWVALAIAAGLLLGGLTAARASRTWQEHSERLGVLIDALERREPPPHVAADQHDSMSRAERRLLEVADRVALEVDSLDEQRGEFDAILRSMSEAVVVTGAHGQIVLLNGAARRLFALQPEAAYNGRHFIELCRDPRLQEFIARATSPDPKEVITAEVPIQNPAPRYLEVSAAPVRLGGGAGAGRVFVFHDITRLKAYETLRSDFIANLTHELRTPLTALYGYAETLRKGVDDPDTRQRFLGIIERQSRRLARLIDDLISLSDLERGLTPLKFEPLAPVRILEEAAELMRDQAARAGIELSLKPSAELPEVEIDRDRIHQVMLNLLDNSLKYTPRGGVVTLAARPGVNGANGNERPGPVGVEFVVADSGEGIPAAAISRLTERFYRVDRARSRELGGTGLGLAIVKHIVQLHHGTMRIESRLREGTTVTVWLPLAQPTAL